MEFLYFCQFLGLKKPSSSKSASALWSLSYFLNKGYVNFRYFKMFFFFFLGQVIMQCVCINYIHVINGVIRYVGKQVFTNIEET